MDERAKASESVAPYRSHCREASPFFGLVRWQRDGLCEIAWKEVKCREGGLADPGHLLLTIIWAPRLKAVPGRTASPLGYSELIHAVPVDEVTTALAVEGGIHNNVSIGGFSVLSGRTVSTTVT